MTRILIIDDDAELRPTLRAILEQVGYEVVEAADGQEGLQRYVVVPADVVLLDILMPEREGLETMRALRRLNAQVKVIAMSGGGQTGTMDFLHVAAALGAQRTLHKPFTRQTLLEAVRDLTQSADAPPRPSS
jgi:CheY-like chemotaxis protein